MNPPQTLAQFVSLWGKLILRASEPNTFLFPLDIHPGKRVDLLEEALLFVGANPDNPGVATYPWIPANPSQRDRTQECPEEAKRVLDFAYEWYLLSSGHEDLPRGVG